jgi:hypothetical protein
MNKFLIALMLLPLASYAGDSGCGLGSVVIQKNSKLLQLFSMTTNHTLFTQPLGITFGTSGCTASGIVKNDKQIEYFVESNTDELKRQMAMGSGEKLSALAILNGCQSAESQKVFSEWAQKNYQTIVPRSDITSGQMTSNLKKAAQSAEAIQESCDHFKVSSH